MDFIDAHRRTQCILSLPLPDPCLIGPFEFFATPNDGGIFRRHFEEKPERIRVQLDVAVRVADLEFVVGALADAGDEDLPDARTAEQPHGMEPPIPVIEIADDTDAL